MAMLAKRPDDRPADAEDLLGRIAAVRRGDIPTVVAVPKAQATTAADEEAGTQPTPRAMPLPPGPAAPADAGRPPVTLSEIAAGTVRTPAARHAWAPPIVSGSEVDERHRGAWPFALTLSLLVLVGGAVFVATGPGFDATWKGIVGFASSPPSTAPAPAPAAAARPSTPTPAAVAGRARVVAARVTSVPRGARVTLANGAPIGTTPVEVLVTDGQPLTVRLSAAGHADSEVALEFAAVDAAPDHEVKVTLRPRR
jgi:serine/threonine-protein kinase